MRQTNKAWLHAACLAVLTLATAEEAGAQEAPPSRVGGELGTRADGSIFAVASWQDGTVNFAQRLPAGANGTIQLRGWSQWNAWTNLAGATASTPVTILNSNGTAFVAVRRSDNQIWRTQETTAGSGIFASWTKLASSFSVVGRPAVVRRSSGLLQIYVTDSTGKLWTTSQTSIGGNWGSWLSIAAPSGVALRNSPVVAVNANAAFIFATAGGNNNHLFVTSQSSPGPTWSAWTDLGIAVGSGDAVVSGMRGSLLSVFARNTSGTISYRSQISGSSSWTATATLPGTTTGSDVPAVANQSDGRLALFVRTGNGANLSWQSQTTGTSWSGWSTLQSSVSSAPIAVTDPKGIMHVFVLAGTTASTRYVYERVQTATGATSWAEWQSGYVGGPFSQL